MNPLKMVRRLRDEVFSTNEINRLFGEKHPKLVANLAQAVWVGWFVAFVVSSYCLVNYENAMNHTNANATQQYFTGLQAGGRDSKQATIFSEGPVGYSFLAAIGISVYMWVYQLREVLRSLGYSGDIFAFKEVKM